MPREPWWRIRPLIDYHHFGRLPQGVQDTLAALFLKWTFKGPDQPGIARPLRHGEWLPIQPSFDGGEIPLGEGGLGIVHLWCCIDNNNRVIDRVIVKNVVPGSESWMRPKMWRNGQLGGEPRESMICNQTYEELEAANPGDGQFITRCLGYGDVQDPFRYDANGMVRVYPVSDPRHPLDGHPMTYQIPSYKLYFEYCSFGDLEQQIENQSRLEVVPARKVKGPGGRLRVQKVRSPGGRLHVKTKTIVDVPFHEGFIWRMFEALAKCAVAMQRANVVHGDMAPSNIFFGENNSDRFKIWPIPKLSDFGSSRYIDAMTRNQFTGVEEAMQFTHAPPEFGGSNGGWEVLGLKVTHKTNVWQIGMIITCMMRLEPFLEEVEWRTVAPGQPSRVPPQDQLRFQDPNRREIKNHRFQHANCNYSAELIGLARSCMRYDQARRPSPRQLLGEVRRRMTGRCGGMDTYVGDADGKIPWNKKEKLRDLQKDKWSLDMDTDLVLVHDD